MGVKNTFKTKKVNEKMYFFIAKKNNLNAILPLKKSKVRNV